MIFFFFLFPSCQFSLLESWLTNLRPTGKNSVRAVRTDLSFTTQFFRTFIHSGEINTLPRDSTSVSYQFLISRYHQATYLIRINVAAAARLFANVSPGCWKCSKNLPPSFGSRHFRMKQRQTCLNSHVGICHCTCCR